MTEDTTVPRTANSRCPCCGRSSTAPQQCDGCGKIAELRPYGPPGKTMICLECVQAGSDEDIDAVWRNWQRAAGHDD